MSTLVIDNNHCNLNTSDSKLIDNNKVINNNKCNNKKNVKSIKHKNNKFEITNHNNNHDDKKWDLLNSTNWSRTWKLLKQLAEILTPQDPNNDDIASNDKIKTKYNNDIKNIDNLNSIPSNATSLSSFSDNESFVSVNSFFDMNDSGDLIKQDELTTNKISNTNTLDLENKDLFDLFPKKHNLQALKADSITPCSLNLSSNNNNNSNNIELADPIQFNMMSDGMISSTFKTNYSMTNNNINNDMKNANIINNHNNINISNNSGLLPISPQSNNSPNDTLKNLKDKIITNKDISLNNNSITNINITNSNTTVNDKNNKFDEPGAFICHYCDAEFKIRGYLTRHIKKHALDKAYHCPYYNNTLPPELRCHNSGGFSRRDTYKTHLKARHFTYPGGVKPNARNKSSGHCSHCHMFFDNTDIWIKDHIELGKCNGLPTEYLKKISNNNNNKKKKINNKLKMIKTSNGHSRFVSSVESVVDPKVLLNKDALEAMAIVASNTNNSHILSKHGDNKLIMNSVDFQGHKKPKKKYKPRTNKTKNIISSNNNLLSSSNDDTSNMTTPPTMIDSSKINSLDMLNSTTPNVVSPLSMPYSFKTTSSLSLSKTPSSTPSFEFIDERANSNTNKKFVNNDTNDNNNNINNRNVNAHVNVNNNDNVLTNFYSSSLNFSSSNDSLYLAPLDSEQQSMINSFDGIFVEENISNDNRNANDGHNVNNNFINNKIFDQVPINKMLGKQMEPNRVNEIQLRETKQYLNFYNFLFGTDL